MPRAFLIFLLSLVAAAWHSAPSPFEPITAHNVAGLASVDYVDLAPLAAEIGEISNGWLTLSSDGERMALFNEANEIVVLTTDGAPIDRYAVFDADGRAASPIDAVFDAAGTRLATLHAAGGGYRINLRDLSTETSDDVSLDIEATFAPSSMWFDAEDGSLWVELIGECPDQAGDPAWETTLTDGLTLHYVLSPVDCVADAIVRLGRIAPPDAVTVSSGGDVSLVDLQQQQLVTSVPAGPAANIGHLDPTGHYLAWRAADNGDIHLLDFVESEDRLITSPGEGYIQALFVGNQGDTIVAVDVDFEPVVVAWDVASGQRIDLGEYHSCGRSPDAIRMSRDGTTIAIGCGANIDIWRITSEGS
ncbi:MAG: hypothetical protein IT320_01430 [Anaerolineae bacterium]|nr:hypothetical protein [Anaerolineae bacterium]